MDASSDVWLGNARGTSSVGVGRSYPPQLRATYEVLVFVGQWAQPMDRALEYFRRVAKETDNLLARAAAEERELLR